MTKDDIFIFQHSMKKYLTYTQTVTTNRFACYSLEDSCLPSLYEEIRRLQGTLQKEQKRWRNYFWNDPRVYQNIFGIIY